MELSNVPIISSVNSQMDSSTTSADKLNVSLWNETDWKPFLLMRSDAIQKTNSPTSRMPNHIKREYLLINIDMGIGLYLFQI